jgi:hypothetical protein
VTTVWTIGYESLWPDALVAELSAAGVERVLDVRYRPQSRRPGMSKTKLGLKLAEHGISYEHRRELGTVLCLEANPAGCQRRIVAELLADRLPGLVVEDL